jgi:RimJ/RimL family protein N-acetyltransferase
MFARPGIDEIISITAVINTKSVSVMEKIGMRTNPAENFDHPKVAMDNPLRPHVLYRLKKQEWRD